MVCPCVASRNASDAIDFLLRWHHQDDEVGDRQAQNSEFEGDGFFPANGEYQQSLMIHEPFTREVDLVSLEATVDFGFATLTSATSYYDNSTTQTYDLSGFVRQFLWAYYYFFPRLTAPAAETADDKGVIQELRLASRGGGMLDWSAGDVLPGLDERLLLRQLRARHSSVLLRVAGIRPREPSMASSSRASWSPGTLQCSAS